MHFFGFWGVIFWFKGGCQWKGIGKLERDVGGGGGGEGVCVNDGSLWEVSVIFSLRSWGN